MRVQQTPGLVDAHSHLRSTSLESHGIHNCANLEEALLRFTAMTSVDLEADAFVACSELLLAGVTGVQAIFHTFASKNSYLDQLRQVANGISRSGIRALVILAVIDQAEFLPLALKETSLLPPWLPAKENLLVDDLQEVYETAKKEFPELEFGIGPVGGQWCSDRTLGILGELATAGMRVHSHMLESPRQRAWAGENPLDRLIRFNLLGPKTSLAHGVWCDRDDLRKIADAKAQLITCPGSNAALRAGRADLSLWEKAGVQFGFGLDSAADPVLPIAIASTVMDPLTAINVITRGGVAATDLRCDQDLVIWRDLELGIPESVSVKGKALVQNGELLKQDEYLTAKEQVHKQMLEDQVARTSRQNIVSELLPKYQKALDECLA